MISHTKSHETSAGRSSQAHQEFIDDVEDDVMPMEERDKTLLFVSVVFLCLGIKRNTVFHRNPYKLCTSWV